jgi:hypothetical protein
MTEKNTTPFYGSYDPRVSHGFIGSNASHDGEIGVDAPDAAMPGLLPSLVISDSNVIHDKDVGK